MTAPRSVFGLLALALALACARGAGPEPGAEAAPKLLDLGDHHRPITTTRADAQRYFDQGLILTFGFNHAAAVRAFRYASRLDPGCAACAWGEALALGPNINLPMGPDAGREAWAAAQRALALAGGASEKERALIEALAQRYAEEPPTDRTHLDQAYAQALGRVQRRFPEDVDVAVLTAEALMNLYPWNYWTRDAQPREHTLEILALLEWAMDRQPDHVGANHYYIHATEEHFPERAEAAADRLGPVAPDAGHLVHMPSHIYWRVGRYEDALEINRRAAAADEQFFSWCRSGPFYRALYYPHNVHFLWSAAAVQGRREIALTAARKLEASVEDQLEAFPLVEEFISIPTLTLARFGHWDQILGLSRPPAERVYLTGIWHYARGYALARTGRADQAEDELAALRATARRSEAAALRLAGDTASADTLLSIGAAHLEGEIAAVRGRTSAAVAALETAVALQDDLIYMEPPPWYLPIRQALGAVLLDAGRPADAEAVYRKDLEQYPKNGWSLFGLSESLAAQGRAAEAAWAAEGHRRAFAHADVSLAASRF